MEEPIRLGKYKVISLLATGGMGEVFLARHEGPAGFSKTVVVKRILRHLAYDQSFIDMFLNEARLAALLSHHNIVQIFELGQEDDTWFIAMEYVHGRSMRAIQSALEKRREVASPALAARLCSQALRGLHYAHCLTDERGQKLGIVHRDISPDNVLVSFAGVVKLVDFGIAKAMNSVSSTRSGTLKGKWAYMAPEQLRGGGVIDARTDIYAMGVLLYELLTAARPFEAESDRDLIAAVLNSQPRPARERNPAVPEAMEEIAMRALAREPDARFPTADAMATALDEYLRETGETITDAHIGSFLTDLFGAEAAYTNPSVAMKPVTDPSLKRERRVMGTAVLTDQPDAPAGVPDVVGLAATEIHELPPGDMDPNATELHEAPTSRELGAKRPRRRGRALPYAIAGGATALSLATALYFAFREDPPEQPSPTPIRAVAEKPKPRVATEPLRVERAERVEPPAPAEKVEAVEPADADEKGGADKQATAAKASAPRKKLKPGKVSLRVNPWAEVFYEGKSLGITPMPAFEVPAGVASFTLKNKELGVTKKVTVRVPPGGEVVRKVDLFQKRSSL